MSASELAEERVNLAYEGPYLRTVLWLLITYVISILVIPAAWATAFLYRRILPQISFSDGTRAAFQGRAGQVWGWFVLPAILYVMCIVVGGIVYNGEPFSLILLSEDIERSIAANGDAVSLAFVNAMLTVGILAIVVTFFSIYVQLVIVRWAIAGINLSDGPELHFAGRYRSFVGLVPALCLFVLHHYRLGLGWQRIPPVVRSQYHRCRRTVRVPWQWMGHPLARVWHCYRKRRDRRGSGRAQRCLRYLGCDLVPVGDGLGPKMANQQRRLGQVGTIPGHRGYGDIAAGRTSFVGTAGAALV